MQHPRHHAAQQPLEEDRGPWPSALGTTKDFNETERSVEHLLRGEISRRNKCWINLAAWRGGGDGMTPWLVSLSAAGGGNMPIGTYRCPSLAFP